jgi:hypothetical protein
MDIIQWIVNGLLLIGLSWILRLGKSKKSLTWNVWAGDGSQNIIDDPWMFFSPGVMMCGFIGL